MCWRGGETFGGDRFRRQTDDGAFGPQVGQARVDGRAADEVSSQDCLGVSRKSGERRRQGLRETDWRPVRGSAMSIGRRGEMVVVPMRISWRKVLYCRLEPRYTSALGRLLEECWKRTLEI